MNFLSHFYLHRDVNDNYFTVGLTLPDLFQFQSRKIRFTNNSLSKLYDLCSNPKERSIIKGMLIHLYVDTWFHNHSFFKETVSLLEKEFVNYNEIRSKLPNFFAHILCEIFIDRFILDLEPTIADEFYKSYQNFNFFDAVTLLKSYKKFDEEKFLLFANQVANSTFLKEYKDDSKVLSALKRVCYRLELPFNLPCKEKDIIDFINHSYKKLEQKINIFLTEAKKELFILL